MAFIYLKMDTECLLLAGPRVNFGATLSIHLKGTQDIKVNLL